MAAAREDVPPPSWERWPDQRPVLRASAGFVPVMRAISRLTEACVSRTQRCWSAPSCTLRTSVLPQILREAVSMRLLRW